MCKMKIAEKHLHVTMYNKNEKTPMVYPTMMSHHLLSSKRASVSMKKETFPMVLTAFLVFIVNIELLNEIGNRKLNVV